jgi:hypothetical protein
MTGPSWYQDPHRPPFYSAEGARWGLRLRRLWLVILFYFVGVSLSNGIFNLVYVRFALT